MDNASPHEPDPQPLPPTPSLRRTILRHTVNLIGVCVILLVAAGIVAAAYVKQLIPRTPGVEAMRQAQAAQPSILLSASGTHLATFSQGQQQRVALNQISPYVILALVATEDHRFYAHPGVDLQRTLSALLHTARGDAQGGSTITQQLVRNMFPEEIGRSRTLERKLREIITAVKIENAYTKDEILEIYLNTVPFLYNVVGIEMAARTYYNKSAADLDLLESATLVGMLKGTSYYNPVLNPERAEKRRNIVLGQMVKHGMLAASRYEALRTQPLQVVLTRQPDPLGSAPHFAAQARRQLIEWADVHGYNIYTDGLIVHSTLDDRLQQAAADAVERQAQVLQNIADVEWGRKSDRVASHSPGSYATLRKKVEPFSHFWKERADLLDQFIRESPEYRKAVSAGKKPATVLARLKADEGFLARLRESKTRLEAGFVAMDPGTGAVKAWVGSRAFERDQFDHVAQAVRQPGSTFKPIVYGAALEHGFQSDRVYPDGEVEIRAPDGSIWRPTDMNGFSGQMMSMRDGLIFSKNTITAQVMQDVGLPRVIDLARAVGIRQSRLDPVPSLSLGTSPVTLLEMVSAYATIAQLGEHRPPLLISTITDRDGNVLAEFESDAQRAMSEDTAVELIDMMRGVVRRGTGTEVRNRFNIVADIAGKTGTTQNNTDGWFILMHPNLVAGAWVGFNDSRVTMRSDYWGQGGHNALLLVGDFFRDTLKARLINMKAKFPPPKRPPPLIVKAPASVDDASDALPSGYGVITSGDSATTVVIAPEPERPAGNPDDLDRFLSRVGSGQNVKAQGDASSGTSAAGGDAQAGGGIPVSDYGE